MKPPRAMRFVLAMLLCYAFPPVFTLSLLESALSLPANWTNQSGGPVDNNQSALSGLWGSSNGTLGLNMTLLPVPPKVEEAEPILEGQGEQQRGTTLSLVGGDKAAELVPGPGEVPSTVTGPGCVMRGQCHESISGHIQNCHYTGPPKKVDDEKARDIWRSLCPSMAAEFGDDAELCCDADQIYTLERSMGVPQQFFIRCPACFHNFAQLWCQSTCHPRQADFLQPTKVLAPEPEDPGGSARQGGSYVAGLKYYAADSFIDGIYRSCHRVQSTVEGQLAIDLMCGRYAGSCTPERWLEFMGSQAINTMAPFDIQFVVSNASSRGENGGFVPHSAALVPCSQAPDPTSLPCSCQDCADSCRQLKPYPLPTHAQCSIGNMDCFVFISLLAFGSLCVVTLLMAGVHCMLMSDHVSTPLKYPATPLESARNGGLNLTTDSTEFSFWETLGAWVEEKSEGSFGAWGSFCVRHPLVVFSLGLTVSLMASSGLYFMEVTTDPVKLWSSEGSRSRQEKDFFDDHFSPFYRTEQLIISPVYQSPISADTYQGFLSKQMQQWGPVFRKEFMHQILDLEERIGNLTAEWEGARVALGDICFKPLAPDNPNCAVLSYLQYFQKDPKALDALKQEVDWSGSHTTKGDYLTHLRSCFESPVQVSTDKMKMSCMSDYGAPVFPYVVLGGFDGSDYGNASAVVITLVVENHKNPILNQRAEAWEKVFIEFLEEFKSPSMDISFRAERSIQDEIYRESQSDVKTILISYTVMFIYIAFSLGYYTVRDGNILYVLLQSKLLIGLFGVLIVMLSVTSSVGVYAYFGVPATLIIVEVVPFLVLAVGVDNIFIIVQAYQREKRRKDESLEDHIGRICGDVIPSMLLSSVSEGCCFFLGALSSMPAVKIFSLYAALAILFDFFLQVTCFLALLTLDIRRQESGRLELFCCKRVPPPADGAENQGTLHSFMRNCYTPFIMKKPIRYAVFIVFLGWLFSSVAVLNKIEVGLDQKLSMPHDSYVLRYFESMEKYLSVGPPVYFVVEGELDYAQPDIQNLICGSSGCSEDSLYGQIYQASHYKNRSLIAAPVMSWLDDYFDWLRPMGNPPCCRLYTDHNDTFCHSTESVSAGVCQSCRVQFESGRPKPDKFYHHIHHFLSDNPNMLCAKGGHAAYGKALAFGDNGRNVTASYFMTYHTILKSSADYIGALRNARHLTANITQTINAALKPGQKPVRVFPYSVFYVFYEQYLSIVHEAVIQLILSMAAIFLVSTVFLGVDPWAASMVVVTIVMILIDLCGLMYWWGITFNAISLVNLVMAVGISVEFCAHIVRAYSISVMPTRVERAKEALADMGSSVLSGITLTKFGGIVVLAFSHSQIFQMYYFRMYLGIVFFGAAHGLIFLPVLLSFMGPSVSRHRAVKRRRELGESGGGSIMGMRVPVSAFNNSCHHASENSLLFCEHEEPLDPIQTPAII